MPRAKRSNTISTRQFGIFKFPEVNCEICGKEVKYDKYSYLKGLVEIGYVYDTMKILDTMTVGETTYNLYALKHLDCSLNERRSSVSSTQSN